MKIIEDSPNPERAAIPQVLTQPPQSGCSYVVYTGTSMNPTLQEPDLMEVVQVSEGPRIGDVVVYRHPGSGINVVHRIIRAAGTGRFHTKGDNNRHADAYTVGTEQIIGIVKAAYRGERRRIIRGGLQGRAVCRFRYSLLMVNGGKRRFLSAPYRLLSRISAPIAHRILTGPFLSPRVVAYPGNAPWRYQVFLGNRFIGRYSAETSIWDIRRPYRLIVDVRKLPQ